LGTAPGAGDALEGIHSFASVGGLFAAENVT
jgi:hypothetical protein